VGGEAVTSCKEGEEVVRQAGRWEGNGSARQNGTRRARRWMQCGREMARSRSGGSAAGLEFGRRSCITTTTAAATEALLLLLQLSVLAK
jgi:hypothetical protein